MGNFTFLEKKWVDLAKLGDLSEKYVYSDPNTSIIKQGMLSEVMVKYMLAYDGIAEPEYDNTHANRIRLLKRKDLLPREIDNILFILRKGRNDAAHNVSGEKEMALGNLKLLYDLCVWFMQIYGDYDYTPKPYIVPADIAVNIKDLERENKELEERNKALVFEIKNIQKNGKADNGRRETAYNMAVALKLTEAQTREIIDEQLRKCGWEAETKELRYSKGTRPAKGRNLAIAEWPTDSKFGKNGYADYALFIGEKLVGIIEAKRKHTDISSVLDGQCKGYARMIKKEHQKYVIGRFGKYMVPFLYATNGRPYIKQYEQKSGIWFLDVRESFNAPKALAGWPTPDDLEQALEKNIVEAEKKLAATGYEVLQDPDGLNLRYYQIEAIKAAEKAIAEHKQEILLAMATGTGKTRTILGMVYRFLEAGRFKRILYLVDRTSLGDQTMDTFREVRIKELLTLDKIYDVKSLKDKEFEKDTRVHIATVQSLIKRIMYNESDKSLGVSDYDLIIIDEAHRGYVLDRQMDEDEVLYRDENDFRSKYRAVIEYFDAVKIALTATPARHTTEIFGEPVYSYDYWTAVVDGFLVDHDAPHIIKTKLSEEGIKFKKGATVPIYDPVTNQVTNSSELEDDLEFEIEDFNRRVVNENFNKTVLEEIAKDIDPVFKKGKTLIFAVDDSHADMITHILKDYYTNQGVAEEAVMKITGSIENGSPEKIKEAIRKFKNEKYPNIVVTVDLLTTGIDVEKIVNLVFMRRIRSRILFEQMLGRATRLCGSEKTHFEIYDAVGVYNALEPVSTMKPVVASPTATFDELIDGIDSLDSDNAREKQIGIIIAKIRRNRLNMDDKDKEQFERLTGDLTPEQFIENIRKMSVDKAVEALKNSRQALGYVRRMPKEEEKFLSDDKDKITGHTRGYGDAAKPEDYLEKFRKFIDDKVNEIEAINIAVTRPKELTRKSLKELRCILGNENFSETMLRTAWREKTNKDINADIISFVRQKSINDALISKDERIHNAIEKAKANHPELGNMQINCLNDLEKQLCREVVLDKESFESEAFKNSGGYNAVNKLFNMKLDEIIDEINEYMYSE